MTPFALVDDVVREAAAERRPVTDANVPVREPEVTIWNVEPSVGWKPAAVSIASVPPSVAAPPTASWS